MNLCNHCSNLKKIIDNQANTNKALNTLDNDDNFVLFYENNISSVYFYYCLNCHNIYKYEIEVFQNKIKISRQKELFDFQMDYLARFLVCKNYQVDVEEAINKNKDIHVCKIAGFHKANHNLVDLNTLKDKGINNDFNIDGFNLHLSIKDALLNCHQFNKKDILDTFILRFKVPSSKVKVYIQHSYDSFPYLDIMTNATVSPNDIFVFEPINLTEKPIKNVNFSDFNNRDKDKYLKLVSEVRNKNEHIYHTFESEVMNLKSQLENHIKII